MCNRIRAGLTVCIMASLQLPALGQAQFTTVDYPGADATYAFGINPRGDIVGAFEDDAGYHAFVVRNGQLMPIPEGFYLMSPRQLWPVLTSPLLSLRGKLRLLAEPFVLRSTDGADESVASFARRRLGREVFER